MNAAGELVLLIGGLFVFLAALGLVRMPDVYSRLQAGTKAATLGALAILLGLALSRPDWGAKLLVIALFLLLGSPISSSTIARCAELMGIRPHHDPEERS
jgi:multicomponent Na+:H+ antiporter subunit G